MIRLTLSILWPSFVAAGIGIGIIFTLVDPLELVIFGEHTQASRTAIYSLGFFILWAIAAFASAMSCLLLTSDRRADKKLSGGVKE
ncbi:MAG: hypothetical protein WCL29_06045 [Pseudomonadota bacterium]